jgi:tetratricopeptide (TPR) repeat protein
MLRELVEALEMLGKQRSVVLLIEDLHWADNSTADLLAYLAQRSDPARLLVVGTYRPAEVLSGGAAELVSVLQARGRCSEVSVAQLSRQAVADYLELRFEQHRLPSAVPELIHRRTEGHALYMIGLVDGWLNHGLISTASGHCQLESNLDELARCVPDSFVRMVELDLRRLSPLERSVIEAASVVGNEFSTAAVAAALGADLVQVEEVCLQSSWRAGFFRRLGAAEWNDGTLAECFEFTHVLYQQVTYNQLGAARQAQWHQRIGERLELAHGKGAELIAPQLALHFHRGRDYRRAVHYLRRAGERALGQSAYHEGIAHLSRAIELSSLLPDTPERRSAELDLLLLVARPLGITKGYGASELEAIYARISQLSERGTSTRQRLLALAGIGAFHLVRNSSQTALSIGDEILQLAKDAGDAAARADAHALIGAACHFLGEHRKAEEHLLQAIAFHDANQGRSFMNITAIDNGIVARGMLAHSYWLLGYSLRGQEEVAISLQKVQDSRNAVATAHALSFASAVAILARDFAASRRYLAVLAGISGERGLEMYAATRLMHEGSILIEQGSPEQGIESIERGWRAYAATGTEAYASYWSCCLARAHRSVGRSEAALQILNRALSVDRSRRDLLWESELLRLRGEILVESEQPNSTALEDASSGNHLDLAGEDCLLRALEIARHQSAQILELRAAMSLSRHWWSRAQREQARGLLAKVCEHFDGAEVEPDYVAAKQLLSELAQPQGTTPGNDESSAVCPATAPSSN